MMLTPEQIKAARAMLNLSQKQLAEKAGIAIATLNNIERGAQTDPKTSTVKAIQQSLEAEGIEFINEPMRGTGLCLRPKRQSPENATILIVDDSRADRTLYKNWLSTMPQKRFNLIEAASAKEGLDSFMQYQPDCVILDFMMYGADGFQLLAALHHQKVAPPPIIFVTGMLNEVLAESAKSHGVHRCLSKQSLRKEELYEAVESALKRAAR